MSEIKVVLTINGNRSLVGIQATDCDPVFTPVEGELEEALGRVPGLLEDARQKWAENPRYPKCERPPQPATPAPRSEARPPRQAQIAMDL